MAAKATEPPTPELVLSGFVERLEREKSPLGMLDELPALIAAGYEQVDEEDIVRLKWWGLYHDKPKIGTPSAGQDPRRDHLTRAAARDR